MNKKPQFPMISVVGVILIVSATALWFLNPLRGFGGNQIFPISLRSSNYANYSQDPGGKITTSQQPLFIIEEVIRNLQEFFIPESIRLQSGTGNQATMTPTTIFLNLFTSTATIHNPTASVIVSSTTSPGITPSPTSTANPSQTDISTSVTNTPLIFTETQSPTPLMSRTPNRTNHPPTSTFSPTNTFTPFYTYTRTNTFTYTPTSTYTPSPTPIPPTRTPTLFIPTSTPIPTGYPAPPTYTPVPSTYTPVPSTPEPTSPGYP